MSSSFTIDLIDSIGALNVSAMLPRQCSIPRSRLSYHFVSFAVFSRQMLFALRRRHQRCRRRRHFWRSAAARHRHSPVRRRRLRDVTSGSDVDLTSGSWRRHRRDDDVIGPVRSRSSRQRHRATVDWQIVDTGAKSFRHFEIGLLRFKPIRNQIFP